MREILESNRNVWNVQILPHPIENSPLCVSRRHRSIASPRAWQDCCRVPLMSIRDREVLLRAEWPSTRLCCSMTALTTYIRLWCECYSRSTAQVVPPATHPEILGNVLIDRRAHYPGDPRLQVVVRCIADTSPLEDRLFASLTSFVGQRDTGGVIAQLALMEFQDSLSDSTKAASSTSPSVIYNFLPRFTLGLLIGPHILASR